MKNETHKQIDEKLNQPVMQLNLKSSSVQMETGPICTVVHQREIPDGLKAGTVDVGIVWATETKNALEEGAPVQAVTLPAEDSLINEVSYAIGTLTDSSHKDAASQYLKFLQTDAGQEAYAKFGFVKASKDDLAIKAIP